MRGSRASFGLLCVLSLLAHLGQSARMVAKEVSLHASLTSTQQQFRKESLRAEGSMVCRTTSIRTAINAKKSAYYGIPTIRWPAIQKTAAEGLAAIKEEIAGLEKSIPELVARYQELKESEKYGAMPKADIVDMIKASCAGYNSELNQQGESCELAISTECGYTADPRVVPPWDGPVDAFTQAAEAKHAKYTTLDPDAFGEACMETFGEGGCSDLCYEFGAIAEAQFEDVDSYTSMDNTETSDDVFAKLEEQRQKLDDAKAAKTSCEQAQGQLKEFADQLNELSSDVKSTKRASGAFKRTLVSEEILLEEQIKLLNERIAELETAKQLFADATEQVKERQADVDVMVAELKRLEQALKEQQEKIRQIREHLDYIEAALETGRLFKAQLARVLVDAVAYNNEAVTKPLRDLGMTPTNNIVKSFGDAEAAAAPAMKDTVNAVGDYCGSQEVVTALNGITVVANEKNLNYICTGQDWNNVIAEAQDKVKQDAKTVVDILVKEQAVANADTGIPHASKERDYSLLESEPAGLRQALAVLGDEQGSFVKGYAYPGWAANLNGNAGDLGKMLKLYQKLGEVFEQVTTSWNEAKEVERQLMDEVAKTSEKVERLKILLQAAIKAQEIAKAKMDEAQRLVDEAEATKKVMEENVAVAKKNHIEGEAAFEGAKEAFMAERDKRAANLLQLFAELQK